MTGSAACPACGAPAAKPLERLSTRRLRQGWLEPHLQVDVAALLPATAALALHRCDTCDLTWFHPATAGDAAFYAALQAHDWYYQDDKPEYAQAAAQLGGAALRVLEVGCGAGRFARHLPAGSRYRGLEFNDAAVARARAVGLDVQRRDLADEAAAAPGAWDVVCHFQVLEHVADPGAFMRHCVRALRPGGLLLAAVPSDDAWPGQAVNAWLNLPPHHLTRWSDRALLALFAQVGAGEATLWHEPLPDAERPVHDDALAHAAWARLAGQPLPPSRVLQRGLLQRLAWRWPRLKRQLARQEASQAAWAGRGHTVLAWGRTAPLALSGGGP